MQLDFTCYFSFSDSYQRFKIKIVKVTNFMYIQLQGFGRLFMLIYQPKGDYSRL